MGFFVKSGIVRKIYRRITEELQKKTIDNKKSAPKGTLFLLPCEALAKHGPFLIET